VLRLKRAAAVAASVLLPLSAAACTTALTGADQGDIVIAADLELTGAYADVGVTYQRALQLKVDQINAAGGVAGRKLRLDTHDNRSDPTVSVSNVSTIVTNPDVAAIVSGWSGDCLITVAKTLDDKHMPTISLAPASGVARPVADRQYIFKIGPNVDDTAALLANRLKSAKMTSVAMVGTNDSGGKDAANALRRAVGKIGVEVTHAETFQPTDTDLSQPVRAALKGDPDALVVSAFASRALAAARAARDSGYQGHIYFDQSAAGELFLTGMGARDTDGINMVSTESMVIDNIIATSPAKVARRQWFNDYTARFGNFSEYSTYAADAVQAIANALETTGATGAHEAIRASIEAGQFEGLTGQIRMSPENHSGLIPQSLTMLVARGDRWQPAA
jgi:branched-chain amino acid transport system substrate-binding protein